jgi:protein gp37
MSESSVIEWTDSTWNPWRGCDKVSPGCAHCYMFRDQRRYGRDPSVVVRCSPATFNAPLSAAWARVRTQKLAQKGAHHVFTCSWSDWFHEDADEWRDEAWDIIRRTPESTYQILTKRSDRIADHLPADWGNGWPNVWLGVTIEHRRFVGRADDLRAVPAAVRFISAEPLLGLLVPDGDVESDATGTWRNWRDDFGDHQGLELHGIDWLIAGGESGGPLRRRLVDEHNQPREDRINWVRDLRDACLSRDKRSRDRQPTAFLFKQWGGTRPTSAGRLLDDRTWDQMPL